MSRRDSRASINARQNDALFEFENFKKKFLLANKHITKLNSTLSIRIEELNGQISMLYVENLRLRASEIALAAQLKREKEKSRKIMADAETATLNLTKHLSYLRQAFGIRPPTPTPAPPSPRARQRPAKPDPNQPPDPNSPVQGPRISRAPNIPGIQEDDEAALSTASLSDYEGKPRTPPNRRKSTKGSSSSSSSGSGSSSVAKSRLSASKLPLPLRVSSPPLTSDIQGTPMPAPIHLDLHSFASTSGKRKTSRRQSGMLDANAQQDALSVPRAPSPAFGSPIRRAAGLAEEEEEVAAANGAEVDVDEVEIETMLLKKERKKSKKDKEKEAEAPPEEIVVVKKRRAKDVVINEDELALEEAQNQPKGKQNRLKDVTNSPRTRAALLPICNSDVVSTASSSRTFLEPVPRPSQLPTPRSSISPTPGDEPQATIDAIAASGRERRARKSVNYAEPKLNTKMRKDDPPPGTTTTTTTTKKKRTSAAAVMSTAAFTTKSSSKSENVHAVSQLGYETNDTDIDAGARSSLDAPSQRPQDLNPLALRGIDGSVINPAMFPLPPSRPGSALASNHVPSPGPPVIRDGSSTSGSVKRKKSRHALVLSDEDDGSQADAEFGGLGVVGVRGASGWVNIEGRRKGTSGSGSGSESTGRRTMVVLQDVEDTRRHSMAI
ncbi:hypothetical protein BDN72DRAFT_960128 [Pluteus cervinus]|uniref:Uncharacterized protein n=1 Tax=Pluteus cervinus TaxID=181527 RepID=A0ACD3ATQ8_9AGAR|nr:hypothetical protein BDN72DRAFT_960128 [Pluteus cervinus]